MSAENNDRVQTIESSSDIFRPIVVENGMVFIPVEIISRTLELRVEMKESLASAKHHSAWREKYLAFSAGISIFIPEAAIASAVGGFYHAFAGSRHTRKVGQHYREFTDLMSLPDLEDQQPQKEEDTVLFLVDKDRQGVSVRLDQMIETQEERKSLVKKVKTIKNRGNIRDTYLTGATLLWHIKPIIAPLYMAAAYFENAKISQDVESLDLMFDQYERLMGGSAMDVLKEVEYEIIQP